MTGDGEAAADGAVSDSYMEGTGTTTEERSQATRLKEDGEG